MIEISDTDFRTIRDKLPLVLRLCRVDAADLRSVNAVRQLTLVVRKFRKPLRVHQK